MDHDHDYEIYASSGKFHREFMMQAATSTRSGLESSPSAAFTMSTRTIGGRGAGATGSSMRHLLNNMSHVVVDIPEVEDDFTIPTSIEAYNSYGRKVDTRRQNNKRRYSRRYDGKRISHNDGSSNGQTMSYTAARLLQDFSD